MSHTLLIRNSVCSGYLLLLDTENRFSISAILFCPQNTAATEQWFRLPAAGLVRRVCVCGGVKTLLKAVNKLPPYLLSKHLNAWPRYINWLQINDTFAGKSVNWRRLIVNNTLDLFGTSPTLQRSRDVMKPVSHVQQQALYEAVWGSKAAVVTV